MPCSQETVGRRRAVVLGSTRSWPTVVGSPTLFVVRQTTWYAVTQ
ncbi:hypothetical protein [Streptomyces sp. NPDC002403]